MKQAVIIGGGAAGLFAAGLLTNNGIKTVIIEHKDKCGNKLAITGKGRCNVTNNCDEAEFLRNVRHNPKFLYSAINAFSPAAAMEYFKKTLALPLMEERGRRVFPQSEDAQDVISALLQYCKGAEIIKAQAVKIKTENGCVKGVALKDGRFIEADAVLLATGGLSYPTTGSTGLGHKMAKQLGHSITNLQPSLVSLKIKQNKLCEAMMGLSLKNVGLSLYENNKKIFDDMGEMLFTHFGISGPLVLTASAFLGDMQKNEYYVKIDLKPALNAQQLEARIIRDFEENSAKNAAHALDKLAANSMRAPLIKLWGVNGEKRIAEVNKKERAQLVELLKGLRLDVASRGDLSHAVITAGGVSIKEVMPKTMQSKLVQGLYFAGEILDVDAYTGGYNLQIAWSTAYLAADSIMQENFT